MPRTINGITIAIPTHTFGASIASLKRHMIILMIAAMMTANVPGPMPSISPLYISGLPVSGVGVAVYARTIVSSSKNARLISNFNLLKQLADFLRLYI